MKWSSIFEITGDNTWVLGEVLIREYTDSRVCSGKILCEVLALEINFNMTGISIGLPQV